MITDDAIAEALKQAGSQRGAARMLGMPKSTLHDRLRGQLKVKVTGIIPKQNIDVEKIIANLVQSQRDKERQIERSRSQRIVVDDSKAFVIALFSDLHIGNNKTDYASLVEDTALVRDCPFCVAMTAGDHSENWIGKLGWISREQHMSLDQEQHLLKWWFGEIQHKLVAVCSGNHDSRSVIAAGIDYVREIIGDKVLLYDLDQILFTLQHCENEAVFKIRHRDQYKSILNPFHGAFRDIERGDCPWDVYISGHDHKATLFGDYIHHDKPKLACRLGTYKMDDRYGKYLGFARSYGTGCGALVVMPNGIIQGYSDLKMAIQFCKAMR